MIKLKKGDLLKSKAGDWHEVLKVVGEGYAQSTNGISIQSHNYPKSKSIIYIFDGEFMNKRSIEDVERMYEEIK